MIDRRALIATLAAAPAIGAPSTAFSAAMLAPSGGPLSDYGAIEWLAFGADNADAEFARACSAALELAVRRQSASDLHSDAEESALNATPPFPAGLCFNSTRQSSNGARVAYVEQCRPDGMHGFMVHRLAADRAALTGETQQAAEAALEAEYAAWKAAGEAAHAHFLVDDLDRAAAAASDAYHAAIDALLEECPARNADALMCKLHLWGFAASDDQDLFDAVLTDTRRVIRNAA